MGMMLQRPRLYIDMDGVLADFDGAVETHFGVASLDELPNRFVTKLWDGGFSGINFFGGMKPMPDAVSLWECLHPLQLQVPVMVLSSTGNERSHGETAATKAWWLHEHGFHAPCIFVRGTMEKASFSGPGQVLIDDRSKVIEAWEKNDGIGFQYCAEKNVGSAAQSDFVHIVQEALGWLKVEYVATPLQNFPPRVEEDMKK